MYSPDYDPTGVEAAESMSILITCAGGAYGIILKHARNWSLNIVH